jgi:hypothetical protein
MKMKVLVSRLLQLFNYDATLLGYNTVALGKQWVTDILKERLVIFKDSSSMEKLMRLKTWEYDLDQ